MDRPRLSAAITWSRYERAVLAVFIQALRRLALLEQLPVAEEPLNLELYWLAIKVHQELLNSPEGSYPFTIDPDSTNQPEPDDSARSRRLKKRPDFKCLLKNEQASDFRLSQVAYYLECKRLGANDRELLFNEFYSEHGIQRFIHIGWGYAKGSTSASMIGYLQNMEPEKVLSEVNAHATARKLPSLRRAAATWGARNVTELSQPPLSRPFEPTQIELNHLWIDLRHCRFDLPSDQRPQSAAPPKPVAKKATKRKSPKKGSL